MKNTDMLLFYPLNCVKAKQVKTDQLGCLAE